MSKSIKSKGFALMLSLILVLGSVATAFASTGTIVNGYIAIRDGGSQFYGGTWVCQVDDGEKVRIDATCAEATNHTNPANGVSAEVTVIPNTDIRAKMAYICYKYWANASDDTKYSLSRACSIATGALTYGGAGYDNRAAVEGYYDEARALSSVPSNFQAYNIVPTDGTQKQLGWRIKPEGRAWVKKVTASNNNLVSLCPEQYSLAGAVFWIYDSYDHAIAKGDTGYIGRVTTNAKGESGYITLDEGTYYAIEGYAPKGYKLNPKPEKFTVTSGGTSVVTIADEPRFDPLALKIEKKAEAGADKSLSLEGAEYTVKYYKDFLNKEQVKSATPFRTWIFRTGKLPNGSVGFLLKPEYKIGGDVLFINSNGIPVGLMGTYTVEETKAPKGFAKTEGIISLQQVKENNSAEGVTVLKDVTDIEKTQKVDLELKKKDKETGESKAQGQGTLAGAVYDVYKVDPLESKDIKVGQITTDENGWGILKGLEIGVYKIKEVVASAGYLIEDVWHTITARIKEPNTAVFTYTATSKEQPTTVEIEKTGLAAKGVKEYPKGAELQLLDDSGKVLEKWTTDGKGHTIKGLTVGKKYTIKETKAPEGYLGLEEPFTFVVNDTESVQKHEVFNEPIPDIKTKALFNTGVSSSLPESKVTVIDTVSFDKLLKGHSYTFKGKLVDVNNPNRVIAEGKTTFTPDKAYGNIKVSYTFNAKDLEGTTMVVTEKLYRDDRKGEKLVASHEDILDKAQSVSVPHIKTTATDKIDNGKDLLGKGKQTVIDRVAYSNLFAGKEYKVSGKLMDKFTGKPILDNGREVTSEKTFTPEKTSGYIDLEFTFNADALKGETIVAFEKMYENDREIAIHADIEDKNQSVYVPKIGTTLVSQDDNTKSVLPVKNVTVRDTVRYENLIKDGKYQIDSQLVHKKTGEVLATNEIVFKAKETSGKVNSDLFFDATKLKGEEVVAFETLYRLTDEGEKIKVVAEHKDIEDEGQTVKIEKPETGTTAIFKDGKKINTVNKEMTIVDKVAYSNLVVGKEYTVKGKLMDKETGKPLLVDGKEVTAEKTFTAKEKNGTVDVTFTFDGSGLAKKEVVVFEDLLYKEQTIATHSDINDKGQTVKIVEKGWITAAFDGGNLISTGDNAALLGLSLVLAGSMISLVLLKRKHDRR